MLQIHSDNSQLIHLLAWPQTPQPQNNNKKKTNYLYCGLSNKKQTEQVLFLCDEILHAATLCREIPLKEFATSSLMQQVNCIRSKDTAFGDVTSDFKQLVEMEEGHNQLISL